uniref:Dead box ATP-dependent RNA helicase n=1 Tax=Solanum tuberosum TaxID=4113 RepID=M0ZN28_SOLTU
MTSASSDIRPDRQTLYSSATWPKKVEALARQFLRNPYKEEEAAKNGAVDASLIKKIVQALQAGDDDVVQQNTKAFAARGDLQENQLSPPRPPLVHSTANGDGNGSDK